MHWSFIIRIVQLLFAILGMLNPTLLSIVYLTALILTLVFSSRTRCRRDWRISYWIQLAKFPSLLCKHPVSCLSELGLGHLGYTFTHLPRRHSQQIPSDPSQIYRMLDHRALFVSNVM